MLYLIALIPAIIGAVLYMLRQEIVWLEWLGGVAVGLAVAALMHAAAIWGMTSDTETWSGQVTRAVHYPEWVERYTQIVTTVDSKGHTQTHTEIRYRTHDEYWEAETTLDAIPISKDIFDALAAKLGGIATENPGKSGFDSGDPNIYVARNKTGWVQPVTATRIWKNRIKAAPTVFSFAKVSADIPVFGYPGNSDPFRSDRLLGTAPSKIGIFQWDLLNAELGPMKKVNLIMVGFDSLDSQLGKWQEAKWIGGKKNDLVLCYGGKTNASWSYVFGWTERATVKRNLETVLLNGPIDGSLLKKIRDEVVRNYEIKDWSKFDYISIEPPGWAYLVEIVLMLITQVAYWFWASNNEFEKEN